MTDTARLVASVRNHEGFRANPYLCPAGKLTIGYGRNLEDAPLTGAEWRELWNRGDIAVSLSRAGAERLLGSALARIERQCVATFRWWPRLNDARQNVIVEMAYQLGWPGLLGFRRMLAAIEAGDFTEAAREGLDSKWAREDSPARARRLMRQMEMGVFE